MAPPFRCVVQRLLPLTQYPDSTVRRGGVVGTLRNCCFEHREWRRQGVGGHCGGRQWRGRLNSRAPLDWSGPHPCLLPPPGHHKWLLGPEVDILPFLLLPLAGPEDFSEEEMEREWLRWSLRLGRRGGQ